MRSIEFYYGKNADLNTVLDAYDRERKLSVRVQQKIDEGFYLFCQLTSSVTLRDIITHRHMRVPMLLILLVCMTTPLLCADLGIHYSTGTKRKRFYTNCSSKGILSEMGVDKKDAPLFTVLFIHLPPLLLTTVAVLLMDTFGRRIMLLAGIGTGIVAGFVLFIGRCCRRNKQ